MVTMALSRFKTIVIVVMAAVMCGGATYYELYAVPKAVREGEKAERLKWEYERAAMLQRHAAETIRNERELREVFDSFASKLKEDRDRAVNSNAVLLKELEKRDAEGNTLGDRESLPVGVVRVLNSVR